MAFNNNASLQIGHVIKVPTERSIVETVPSAPVKPADQPQAKPVTTPAVGTQIPAVVYSNPQKQKNKNQQR